MKKYWYKTLRDVLVKRYVILTHKITHLFYKFWIDFFFNYQLFNVICCTNKLTNKDSSDSILMT